jgi:hypothetical protein
MPQPRYEQNPMQQMQSMIMNAAMGNNPVLSTQQVDNAADRSMQTGQARGRDEALFQNQMRRENMEQDGAFQLQQGRDFSAQIANPAANANTARNIALNTANTLNNMYAQSSRNLLDSANNTQNALNNAASTVAGLFR